MPAVNIAPYIRNQYFTSAGVPLSGGLLNAYEAGTNTRKTTYSNAAGTVANTNPIVLDAAGRASIYMASGAYKFVLTDSAGNVIWTEDNVSTSSVITNVDNMTALVALAPGAASIVRTLGRITVNDGGGWWYYWDEDSEDRDDGGMVVQPGTLPAAGRWVGLNPDSGEINVKIYGAVCNGTTDDVVALRLCEAYCASNGYTILVDSSIYIETAATITSTIKLMPGAQFRFGNFNPTPNIKISIPLGDYSQHFNCTSARPIRLITSWICPEWFGESYITDPIVTAAMAATTYGGTTWLRNLAVNVFSGPLNVPGIFSTDGVAQLYGGATVANTLTAQGSLVVTTHTPASASASGVAGRIAWDANYIYVCTADNTWKRAAISTWS